MENLTFFDLFDLTLNRFSHFFVQIKSNCKITVTIEFFVKMDHKTCQMTHLKILGLVTFSDLTLTLTWAKYETISLVSTFAWPLGVHMESFGRKMLRLRSLRSATWKHPVLTFDLTLNWYVTSILNFRKWFGSVSSWSFECRLVCLSTSIRFRDSTGGGVGSDPPGCGGYRNSPGGGGLSRVTYVFWPNFDVELENHG